MSHDPALSQGPVSHRRRVVAVILAHVGSVILAACATPKPGADSTALQAIDTVKPAPPTVQAPDTTATVPPTTTKATKATTGTTKAKTSAKTSAKQKTDSRLGRDSVIRFPGREIPTIPPRKPPQ